MLLTLETLGVYLVNILCARGSSRKPSAGRNDFETADGSAVARSFGEFGSNGLARKIGFLHRGGRELLQFGLLLGSCSRIDACVVGSAKLLREVEIVLTGILTRASSNLSRE